MTDPEFLLDTNICIYILADVTGPAARRLAQLASGSVVTSAIVAAEIERGLVGADGIAHAAADALFEAVPILAFDHHAAQSYATLPFRRASFDRLIAAHAHALNLTLVTNNPSDFSDIRDLKLDNWTQ